MRILWCALTPCGAAETLRPKLYTAGWLASLEQEVKKKESIDLSVCFYFETKISPFKYKSVDYYPISRGSNKGKLGKFINRINLFNPNADAPLISKLVEVIEEVKPDIIHIHGCEENFGLVQKHTQVPIIISLQGILNPCCEKFFSGIPLRAALTNEQIVSKILLDSYRNHFFLFSKWAKREKEILKKARYIMGRTNWDRRISRILAPMSTYFIGNEIMREPFYNAVWNKSTFNTKIHIATIMSGGLFKGLESVLKTASLLTDFGFNFKWILIGQSESDNYAIMVKKWLKKDYRKNNICFEGKMNSEKIVSILCKSDIYCQVSHIENSPNSLCEAMLLGMPIVATFAGGTDSILENNEEGLLVQAGDSFSIAGAILELANDFGRSRQYGNNARKTAWLRHDPRKVAMEVTAAYKEIYASSNAI